MTEYQSQIQQLRLALENWTRIVRNPDSCPADIQIRDRIARRLQEARSAT